jgi:hypothetical protein
MLDIPYAYDYDPNIDGADALLPDAEAIIPNVPG